MQLDDVIATTSPDLPRITEAMHRSIRWLDRCIAAHKHPEKQNLFCIIQGGLDLNLRRQCCQEMVARDTPGIAIGGLSGGEAKNDFCRVYVDVVFPNPSALVVPGHLIAHFPAELVPARICFLKKNRDMLWAW